MAGKRKLAEKAPQSNGLVLSTESFKALVGKAFKGVGNNKLLPLTQLMCIQVKDGTLTLITSDSTGTNYLYVKQSGIEGEFYATVMAEQFAKLIGKLTCDKLTLEVEDGKLKVLGNGNYTIALQYDEMGNAIQYPDPVAELGDAIEDTQTVTSATVYKILNSIKPSLALTMEAPYLTGYYAGDVVTATNGEEMGIYDIKMLNTPALLSPVCLELLALSDAESINIDRYDNGVIVFSTPDVTVYSNEMEGIEDYPVDALKEFFETDMPADCKLPKNELLQALDRIALFVGTYDDNAVKLEFTGKALQISSLAMTGVETVSYISGKQEVFECNMDLQSLIKHIKTQSTDTVEIQFGDEQAVKLVDGDVVQIMSLFENSQEDE